MKKYILILAALSVLAGSCVKEISEGFLSPTGIRLRTDTLEVVKAVYTISDIPMVDGSTRPLKFEILGVKKLPSGAEASAFGETYDVQLWSAAYNPDTDTTMEQVNQKLYTESIKPIDINPVSGQLAFNGGTAFLEDGLYGVDVRVSNSAGSRVLENFGILKLLDRPWEVRNTVSETFNGIDAKGTETTITSILPEADQDLIRKNTHPRYSIEKVGESNTVQVKLIFLDANGDVYPGSAISKRPYNTTYYNCWYDNSLDTKVLDDGVEFNFPTVPYPAFGRVYGDGDNLYLSYYMLPPSAYTLTDEARILMNNVAAEQEKDFTDHLVGVRLAYKINQTGIWHVKVTFAKTIKR